MLFYGKYKVFVTCRKNNYPKNRSQTKRERPKTTKEYINCRNRKKYFVKKRKRKLKKMLIGRK